MLTYGQPGSSRIPPLIRQWQAEHDLFSLPPSRDPEIHQNRPLCKLLSQMKGALAVRHSTPPSEVCAHAILHSTCIPARG